MKEDHIIKSNQYNRQPFWFKMVNGIWKKSYALGSETILDVDSLLKAAKKETGLNDFGKDFWVEPLEVLIKSMNEEANLHPIGRFISRQRLINLLSVRLRAKYYFKKYPEILKQDLYPCKIIVGLQRTGTTKLQRLLASDPDSRSLLSWEALNPSPVKSDIKTGKERIKIAKTSVKALKYMSPGFFAIHPIEYDAPEEDVLLLDVSFLSTTAEATMNVPTYASWLENNDQSPGYQYMVKLLKLLQWQRPGKRWILKTPHHLEFLPLLKKYLGDVQFIWTHRDVKECIPSFLSMVSYSRVLFSNNVNTDAVSDHWLRKNAYMLSKALEFRHEKGNDDMFIDVKYKDLVADPFLALERIYQRNNEVISNELSKTFKEANLKNPKAKYGVHQYDMADFGIDASYFHNYALNYQEFQRNLGMKI